MNPLVRITIEVGILIVVMLFLLSLLTSCSSERPIPIQEQSFGAWDRLYDDLVKPKPIRQWYWYLPEFEGREHVTP